MLRILQVRQEVREQRGSVVVAVADQEGKVDQVVRVGQVLQMGEEHGQVGRGVSQWGAEQYALFPLPSSGCAADVGQIVVPDSFYVEFFSPVEEAEREGGYDGGGSQGGKDEHEDEKKGGEHAAESY